MSTIIGRRIRFKGRLIVNIKIKHEMMTVQTDHRKISKYT